MDNLLNPIIYSDEQIKTIQLFSDKMNIMPALWDIDDLEDLRKEIRKFYRKEQKATCAYCKHPVSIIYPTNCHIEHIAPKSLYPTFIFEPRNLCVICADCNQIKRNQETVKNISDPLKIKSKQYPTKSEDFFIVHPHYDKYDDHILIINGYYIDKGSRKGNFTIGACLLNRKLLIAGWEPDIVDHHEFVNVFNEFINENETLKRNRKLEEIKRKFFY